ncbi:MAG: c-type cytochrome [Pseudomonadota bacterium]
MKDPLFGNKVAAAVLSALLLVFGLPQLTAALMGGGHHGGHDDELHLAYCCVELDFDSSGASEAPAEIPLAVLLTEASASTGERRSGICVACHTFNEGGSNGTGPNLWGIVGREVASVPGFGYSSALKEFGGVWTYERLDAYLENSQAYVPGTTMVQRFAKADQRADLLAFLQTMSSEPFPFPEPPAGEPAETAAAEDIAVE